MAVAAIMAVTLSPLTDINLAAMHALECAGHSHPMSKNQLASCLGGRYFALGGWQQSQLLAFAIGETVADEATLIDLVVAPDARRSGLARLLLDALLTRWQEAGVASVFLEVRASNSAAIALYQQQGFNEIGIRRGYYPGHEGREDAILMALALGL